MKPDIRQTTRLLALGLLVFTIAPAAADVNCPPDQAAVEIDDDLDVTGTCVLDGTVVEGNVVLFAGGSLTLRNARIEGNVQSTDSPFEVDIDASRIEGNIQIDQLVGDDAIIRNTRVDGSIQVNENRPRLLITDNEVGGDIQAFDNTGGLDIAGNRVDGNLQCGGNDPAPTGEDNTVEGNRQGQCSRLQPAQEPTPEEPVEAPEEAPAQEPEQAPAEGTTGDTTDDAGAVDPATGSPENEVAEKNNLKGGADPVMLCLLGLLLLTALLRHRRDRH